MPCSPKFRLRSFGLHHRQPHLFTTSQWEQSGPRPHLVTVPYLAFRCALAAFMVANYIANLCLHDAHDLKYFEIYLTNWGITLLTLWTVMETGVTVVDYMRQKRKPGFRRRFVSNHF